MLAPSTVIAPDKNRVGNFFAWSPDCAGQTGTQAVDCDWETEATTTTPRRGNSLAQKGQLPPCSEFFKDGTVSVTTQSFIMDPMIDNKVPWRTGNLLGDGRSFLDSPADGVNDTFRGSNNITVYTNEGYSEQNPQLTGYGLSIRVDNSGNVIDTGTADRRRHSAYAWGNGSQVSVNMISSAGEPFDSLVTNAFAPIYIGASLNVDMSTGTVHGKVVNTRFPSFQVFVNGTDVYNSTQSKSPYGIMLKKGNTINEKLCDPDK